MVFMNFSCSYYSKDKSFFLLQMTRHIILAYGRPVEYNRAIFSVLSFWAWHTGNKVEVETIIFTDRPDFFEPYLVGLPVKYVLTTTVWINNKKGLRNYMHRVKIAVVDHVFREHPSDNILFCDSDTFINDNPQRLLKRIQSGTCVMHASERPLPDVASPRATGAPKNPKIFLNLYLNSDSEGRQTFKVGSEHYKCRQTDFMWNSGVLGLPKEVAELMPDVYALNDAIYNVSEWILSEQVAFTLVLQQKNRLLSSDKIVLHYWDLILRQQMDELLIGLINKDLCEIALPERLNQVRQLTINWTRIIKRNKYKINALHAFSNGWKLSGLKSTVYATLSGAFNVKFAADLVKVLRKK